MNLIFDALPENRLANLSYTKMINEVNKVMLRKHEVCTEDGHKTIKFSRFNICCGSGTGVFCPTQTCCPTLQKSAMAVELGVGMSIYFKQLKTLMLIFLLFTFLSFPSYLLYFSGNEAENRFSFSDSKQLFSTFTLGNLGMNSDTCGQVDMALATSSYTKQSKIEIFCPYGNA